MRCRSALLVVAAAAAALAVLSLAASCVDAARVRSSGAPSVVTLLPASSSTAASFAVSVPQSLVTAVAQQLAPLVAADVHAIKLPTCCYDDVGMSHVHLNLQSLAIGDVSVAVSSLMEPAALSVDATVKVTVTGFVRLCLHDDPFGKGCSTLYNCKGDFSVTVDTLSNTTMSVTANEGTGLPSVTVTDEKASVPSLTSSGLCDKISSQLKSASSQIAAALVKDVPAMVNKAAAAEIAKLPQVFDNKSAVVGFKWALDAGTGVQAGMLVLDGALSMFLAKSPGVVAPLQPRLPIPAPAPSSDRLQVVVADSVFGNVFWLYFVDGMLQSPPRNVSVFGVPFTVTARALAPPAMLFEAGNQSAALSLSVSVYSGGAASGDPLVMLLANATATTVLTVDTAHNALVLQVKAVDVTGAQLDFDYKKNPQNVSLEWALGVIDGLLAHELPRINTALAKDAIAIPAPAGVRLADVQVTCVSGAALVSASVSLVGAGRQRVRLPPAAVDIQCPKSIGGGHLDSCV